MGKVKEWLFNVALKKAVKKAVHLVIAFLAARGLQDWGVTVDENTLILSTFAAIEVLRNNLKVKWGWAWL